MKHFPLCGGILPEVSHQYWLQGSVVPPSFHLVNITFLLVYVNSCSTYASLYFENATKPILCTFIYTLICDKLCDSDSNLACFNSQYIKYRCHKPVTPQPSCTVEYGDWSLHCVCEQE